MGHSGPEAIKHLTTDVVGAEIDGRGPSTIDCEVCAVSKATEIVSRRPLDEPATRIFQRVSYDIVSFPPGYNGHRYLTHYHCDYSHWIDL
ncbi:hypothetical protein M501DRAFT_1000139, partial [Patellaria atrata CBS 101060]